MRVLVIDNYDSFTYNLVQYLGECGAIPVVRRNDQLTVADALGPEHDAIVISPGPGTPDQAGISVRLARACAGAKPLLGVCLGHQAIARAFGARVVAAPTLMHGKTDEVTHDGRGLFQDLPSPLTVMRYHSLMVDPASLTHPLEATAWSGDDLIQAIKHCEAPVYGVQFHPESIGTQDGKVLVGNFLKEASQAAAR